MTGRQKGHGGPEKGRAPVSIAQGGALSRVITGGVVRVLVLPTGLDTGRTRTPLFCDGGGASGCTGG
jgi:hypothetical protein